MKLPHALLLALLICTPNAHALAEASRPEAPPICPQASSLKPLLRTDYGRAVTRAIVKNLFAPQEAYEAGQSGTVQLCLNIAASGEILWAGISQKTAAPILDGTALYAVGLANPAQLPAMPSSVSAGQESQWFALALDFTPDPSQTISQPTQAASCAQSQKTFQRWSEKNPQWPFEVNVIDGSSSATSEGLREHVKAVRLALSNKQFFPPEAEAKLREQVLTGLITSEGRVTLDEQGCLLDARIVGSSGYPLMDAALLITVGSSDLSRSLQPLPEAVAKDPLIKYGYYSVHWDASWNRDAK